MSYFSIDTMMLAVLNIFLSISNTDGRKKIKNSNRFQVMYIIRKSINFRRVCETGNS